MKKRFLLTLMTVMLTCTVGAQVKPIVLGDKHAMLKMEQSSRYLLLPVQETEDIAAIAVLDNYNNMVQRLNVKLAVDRVDYYVPYELKGACLLDIEFHGDRRQKGAVGEFACWREMKYSNTFDTTNSEHFRPVYHHTPLYGWMNDPNGMFYKDGVWHLYYMTWGHSTSKDLIHWEAQPLAIEADWLGSIFSGSCVTNGNEVVAFYTSAGHHQTQSMAVSKDGGRTFKKYSGNPILTTSDIPDFRDPKAFWNEDAKMWNLILAAGQEMRIYSSKDLKAWKYESSFGKEYGNHSGVWECPESMPKVTKWLDYGKDHYATVSFYNAPDNRRTVLAWMSNWQYANQVPTKQFRSANSIPRDLGLFRHGEETYVSVIPSKEMLDVRGAKIKNPTEACEILIDTKSQTEIVLSNNKGEKVTMKYDGQQQTFMMERVKSGDVSFSEAFPAVTVAPTFGTIKQLRIFIDRCSIEVFDAEGKMAMTNLVFPSEPYNTLKVKGGKATIYQVKN